MTQRFPPARALLARTLFAAAMAASVADVPPVLAADVGRTAAMAAPEAASGTAMPASQSVGGAMAIVGPFSYALGNDITTGVPTVRFFFNRVANLSATNTAGNVTIRFVATVGPLPPPGAITPSSYFTMSAFPVIFPFGPGAALDGYEFTYYFTPPPDGTYYMSVLLLESEPATCTNPDRYCVDDLQTAANRVQFVGGVAHDVGPGSGTATGIAIEYYWAARDHYFFSTDVAEIAALDASVAGWQRTGYSFGVYAAPQAGTVPVCRFYIPPVYGDSHYYDFGAALCAAVAAKFPVLVYESPSVANVVPSNATTGACPAGTTPLYKLFNQRVDTNHRYTILPAVRDLMLSRGYILEGNGSPAVAACAPL